MTDGEPEAILGTDFGPPVPESLIRAAAEVADQVTLDILRPELERLGVEHPESFRVQFDASLIDIFEPGDDDDDG